MNAQLSESPRAQWLNERRLGIGGSDVAPILGLSKWSTPLDVYLDKRGEIESDDADNDAMYWGRTLEPVIRQEYANRTGVEVSIPPSALTHPTYTFMRANVDGLTSHRRVFEAKTARSADGWGEPGTNEVPDAYALQTQHYLAVTGYEIADVAVLIGGSDFRIYHVEADRELQNDLIHAESEFWQRVLDGRPPEPVSYADTVRAFGSADTSGNVPAGERELAAWTALKLIRSQIKELQANEEDAKALLMKALGDGGDALVGPDGKPLVTWKLAKAAKRFDMEKFKTTHPDLVEQFTVPGTQSRRFLIKE